VLQVTTYPFAKYTLTVLEEANIVSHLFLLGPMSAGKSGTCFVGLLLLKTHRNVCRRGMFVVFEVINRWHYC
jgi:hypothetical protein